MSILRELEFLNQVYIHVALENEMLKWPNHIPKGRDHILIGIGGDIQLVLDDLHPFYQVVVVVPYSLG